VSELEELAKELETAKRRQQIWMAVALGFWLLGVVSKAGFDNTPAALAAAFAFLVCLIGGSVSAHRHYKTFHRFWSASGLTKDEAKRKWHETYPSGD